MITDVSKELENIIQIRESGALQKSRLGFTRLLKKINKVDPLYPRVIAENIIQLRLEAKSTLGNALKLGQDLLRSERKKHKLDPLSIRSVANTLIDLGGYEAALPLLSELCDLYQHNSLRLGETQAHLAYAYLRVGKLSDADSLIKKAINNIEINTAHENYVEVRSSYAVMVQALIENSQGNKQVAIAHIKKALQIAIKGKAAHRITQVREVLNFFNAN